jgi:chorismate mutase/prephenate dehydratase
MMLRAAVIDGPLGRLIMDLDELRNGIDALDDQIVDLLNQRARLAREIGTRKQTAYAPHREKEVIARVAAAADDPLTPDAVTRVYTEIMSACRAAEQSLAIAFLGPRLTFSHRAAIEKFGSSVEFLPMPSVDEIFAAVAKGSADFGMVPIENSINGVEAPTLDALSATDLCICGEMHLDIHQCLLSTADLEDVRQVFSHPQALAQCRTWLRTNLPRADCVETSSTTAGAERALRTPDAAAIAPKSAESLGLSVLAENIEDVPGNRTRFFTVGRLQCPPTGSDKTSLLFATHHRSGALLEALHPLKENGINLTMIESRPARHTPWEYLFFLDFQGHQQDDRIAAALEQLGDVCTFVRVLGSYPEAR